MVCFYVPCFVFVFFLFLLEHIIISSFSLCRLQQDIQSVSGQRPVAAESRAAPSALHPHRLLQTQQFNQARDSDVQLLTSK